MPQKQDSCQRNIGDLARILNKGLARILNKIAFLVGTSLEQDFFKIDEKRLVFGFCVCYTLDNGTPP